MSARNPAARGKRDRNHKAIADAIRLLGYPVMDLSAAGNGVEDLLVGVTSRTRHRVATHYWVLVEIKVVERESTGYVRYKPAQIAWRNRSQEWPRITVTSAQDAVDQLRGMS